MAKKVVFRPILPKNPRYFESLERDLTTELVATMTGKAAKTLIDAEEKRIANWDHKPRIVSRFRHMKTQLKLHVTPYGKDKRYWVFVSRGTPSHQISPKNYPYLAIKTGYQPKTSPNNMYGGSGTWSGQKFIYQPVQQKIEPRHFEEHIVKEQEANIQLMMANAVRNVLRRY